MTPLLLALDFGGTKQAAALIAAGSSDWLAYRRALSPPDANADTDLEIMHSLIGELLAFGKPAAIGVSFGGPVDTASQVKSHHVPGWENIPLRELLENKYGIPASVDNDANVAALGEYRFGAGQGISSLFYITVSTGVGGGWILNGSPWRGVQGMAGEIGHMVVDPSGPICLCGKRGCVERFASGPYIAQRVKEQLQAQPEQGQILRQLVDGNLEAIAATHVSQAAHEGDSIAVDALTKAGWALGVGIGNVANLINPHRFVLGGGVTKAGSLLWDTVRRVARETALPEVEFDIVLAALRDEAPLWGAVALAQGRLSEQRLGQRKWGLDIN